MMKRQCEADEAELKNSEILPLSSLCPTTSKTIMSQARSVPQLTFGN